MCVNSVLNANTAFGMFGDWVFGLDLKGIYIYYNDVFSLIGTVVKVTGVKECY